LFYLAILAGPCLAGVLLTGIVDGPPGLRELLARLRRWRTASRWYVVALLPALVITATALLLSLASSDFRPTILNSNDRAGIIISAIGPALLVGALEEIGWTGLAVPHLRTRHSILATGLTVGVVWGAWHFPLFWEGDSFSATIPLAVLLTRLFSWLPPFRVLLVWVHDRTQSLPVVMFMHALVSFVSITLSPKTLTGSRLLVSLLVSAATMWLLLAAVGAGSRWRLTRQPAQTSIY
jgi:membrane protease YdiL (CAAX protease family)